MLLLAVILGLGWTGPGAFLGGVAPVAVIAAPLAEEPHPATAGNDLYLPLVVRFAPLRTSIFGVEVSSRGVAPVAERAAELAPAWVRLKGVFWPAVERQQGVYNWDALAGLESDLRLLSERGLVAIVPFKGTPSWAQKVPGYSCGPMREDTLDEYAAFVAAVVSRYSRPPYNVRYWEIWNEPDVAYQLVNPGDGYGCLGDATDPYYGGGYYAQILQAVYPAIKAADPFAKVVFGGLLLDCDPDSPPPNKDCTPGRYLEGALRAGAGPYFDILSYHAYPHWFQSETPQDWDLAHFSWNHRGGIMLGKLDFLRETMGRYGVDKPVMMNEGGLLCHPTNPHCNPGGGLKTQFHLDQANYVVRLYLRAWANGLQGVTWYTLDGPGWREGGLLDEAQQPRPAFRTLRFLTSLLRDAVFEGSVSAAGVEGYAFRRGQVRIVAYWRNDGLATPVALPATTTAVYDYLGNPVSALPGTLLPVGFTPVLVESTVP